MPDATVGNSQTWPKIKCHEIRQCCYYEEEEEENVPVLRNTSLMGSLELRHSSAYLYFT